MGIGLNKVYLFGNVGADPELRYSAAGLPVLSLRLATNESYMDRNREVQQRTEWHTVIMFGSRGEALARVVAKGHALLVEGGLRTTSYEKDGVKRYKTEVLAREICFAGRRAGAPQPEETASSSSPAHVGDELPMVDDAEATELDPGGSLPLPLPLPPPPPPPRTGRPAPSAGASRAFLEELPF